MNLINKFICLIFCILTASHIVNCDDYNFNCVPKETFKELCNTCVCGPDGYSATCTKIGCPRPGDKNFSCRPGEKFNYKCNRCECNQNGRSASCTEIGCPYKN